MCLKVASEVNEAILKAEHADSAQSQLLSSLKLLIWAQGMSTQTVMMTGEITNIKILAQERAFEF